MLQPDVSLSVHTPESVGTPATQLTAIVWVLDPTSGAPQATVWVLVPPLHAQVRLVSYHEPQTPDGHVRSRFV